MADYSRSINIAVTAVMMDRNLNTETKQEKIEDLRQIEEKLGEDEEASELVYPEGTEK